MPKRKAEVLLDDTMAHAPPSRRTRSSRPVSPDTSKTNAKRSTRANNAAPEPIPAKPKVTRTYGKNRPPVPNISTPNAGEANAAELEESRVEMGRTQTAGRATRGRPKGTAEPDAASSSSKENVKRYSKSTRGRGKDEAAESVLLGPEDGRLGEEIKAQQAPKRRKVAVTASTEEPVQSVPAIRNRRGATSTAAPSAEPASGLPRRGRPTKTNTPPPPPPSNAELTDPSPVKGDPISPQIPPSRRKGRPPKAIGQAPPAPATTGSRRAQNAPLSPEIAIATPRRSKLLVPKLAAPPSEDEADSDDEVPPSPLKDRQRSQVRSRGAVSASKRPRSPISTGDGSPRKRKEPPRPKSPLFSEPEEEQAEPPRVAAPTPSSPSKTRAVVVEIVPRTPKRPRRAAVADDLDEETAELPSSPIKQPVFPTTPSQRLRNGAQSVPNSPTKANVPLIQEHLIPCLTAQKKAVLRALTNPPVPSTSEGSAKGKGKAKAIEADGDFDNATAYGQLKDLLEGTTVRNEGNSCLLLGPKGSGKTRLFERCLSEIAQSDSNAKPIVIRLSGWVQSNDRLALRQIAIQLAEQTGNSYLSPFSSDDDETKHGQPTTENDDDNPFLDGSKSGDTSAEAGFSLPSAAHLPALIAELPKLNRPTIVLVDAFDLFSLHPRQALLYCLLDTVQACQSAQGNKGLAVVGLTSRVDVISLLEKRVKSRFSGRILRVSNVPSEEGWFGIVRRCLLLPAALSPSDDEMTESNLEEWTDLWTTNVEKFLADSATKQSIHETYSIVRDVRVLIRVLTPAIARLSPSQPFPTAAYLQRAMQSQRTRTPFASLYTLPYPALCLLIASHHSDQKGHPVFNFEMLYEAFRVQLRASMAAPIQLNGTGIGMVKCSRSVMLSAFEALVAARIFVPAAAANLTTPKEFVKYRSVVEREDLKKAVEKAGQVSLKKWWNKS